MEFWQSLVLLIIILAIPKLRKAYLTPNVAQRPPASAWSASDWRAGSGAGRLPFFDTARGIAIIAVILIHSIYLFVEKFPDYNSFWLDVINNLSRFAVGFFFIASGALLSSGLTVKKIIRVFIPYVLFCVVVGLSQQKSVGLIIGGVFRGDLLPPYYFIPVLFQFYLLFPLLNKFKYKKYFLPATLLLSFIAYPTPGLTYIAVVPTFMPFLFLFTFGIAYSDRLKSNKPFENINLWLLIIPIYMGLILMLPAHYYNSRFFYAPAMFVVLHYLWHKFEAVKSAKLLLTFGKLSLWIYLVHFSVESLFVNLLPYDFNYSVFVYILLITILTTAASGVVAKLFENVYFQFLGLVKKKPLHSLFVKGD